MKEISQQPIFRVSKTDITFDSIYKKPYIPANYIEGIKKAKILVIPEEKFREKEMVYFPETTRGFYEHICSKVPDDIAVDIAIDDNEFQELELHSDTITVATIIVESAVFNIVCGLVVSFLYDMVKKHLKKPEQVCAQVKIIREETPRKKSIMIDYNGPVSEIESALNRVLNNYIQETNDDNRGDWRRA